MTLLNTINVGGTDYGITGAAVIGSCVTPAGSEVKACTFSDTFELKAGDMLLVKFTYANTYGDGSTTYPKLQVNGTNYVMRRADGNYLQSGEWGNNATLTFLFDGTDFILPAGSGSERGSSVPLGTILAIHSNQVPDGYLPCNGVQFDSAQFAALYALLGDDHTPDLREVTLRGIGHNGTYVFDSTETDPSTGQAGTQNHDEYTLGEFKDDQLQDHYHSVVGKLLQTGGSNPQYTSGSAGGSDSATGRIYETSALRKGDVTRGKSVGVNYIIKATSGLPDSQQDYILNQLAPVDEVTVGNVHSVTSNAVATALQVEAIDNEQFTSSVSSSVNMTNHVRYGKLHIAVISMLNVTGSNVGTLNEITIVGDTGYRPKKSASFVAVNFYSSSSTFNGRVTLTSSGEIALSESLGATSGHNNIYATLVWVES